MPEIIPKIRTSVFLLIFGMIFGVLVALVLLAIFIGSTDEVALMQISLAIGELLIPVPIFLWVRKMRSAPRQCFRLKPVSKWSLLAALPLGAGLIILTEELDRIIQMLIPLPENFSQITNFMKVDDFVSGFFSIGVVFILGPLVEELVVRGFFQRVLEYRYKDATKAVLVSALTFALIHFNPWWLIQIYIIGIFLGYVAWRTNSIWVPFLLHAMYNGSSSLISNLDESLLPWWCIWKGHVSPPLLITGAVLLYWGLKTFIRVTPLAERDEDVIFIENMYQPTQPPLDNQ